MIDAGGVPGTTTEVSDEWLARNGSHRFEIWEVWPGCKFWYIPERCVTRVEFTAVPDISSMEW